MTVDWESFTDSTLEAAEVRLLGTVELPSVLALQKLMVHEVRQQSQVSAAVMICEHPPAITAGRDATLLELPTDAREIESRSLEIHRVPRNGGTFFHQEGQLAVYVVMSLAERGFSEAEYVGRLQAGLIAACQESQVLANADEQDLCVINGRHGMICQIGVRIENGVSSFGAVLNVSNRIDEARYFGRGLNGTRISSMNAERARPTIMPQVRSSLIKHICEQIGYPEYHIHTGHPFLKRVSSIEI